MKDFFFNHFNTKRKFHRHQFLDAFFKRDVLQYGLGLPALCGFKERLISGCRKLGEKQAQGTGFAT